MIFMNTMQGLIFKKILIAFFAIVLFVLFIFILRVWNANYNYNMSIIARFSDLGPLYKSMPVYYKGYKVGKTRDIQPSKDYKYTLVYMILYPKHLTLPNNVTAKVQKLDSGGNYIDLIYPGTPSVEFLKTGDIIEGKTAVDIQSFMSAQADSGVLGAITGDLNKALVSLDEAAQSMDYFFEQLGLMVEENRPSVKSMTGDAAKSTQNVREITQKINNSITEENASNVVKNVDRSSSNIEEATSNIKNVTENIDKATKDLDKTMKKIDCVAADIKSITAKLNEITRAFKCVLSKRFAGMRVMFGKPMEEQ